MQNAEQTKLKILQIFISSTQIHQTFSITLITWMTLLPPFTRRELCLSMSSQLSSCQGQHRRWSNDLPVKARGLNSCPHVFPDRTLLHNIVIIPTNLLCGMYSNATVRWVLNIKHRYNIWRKTKPHIGSIIQSGQVPLHQ